MQAQPFPAICDCGHPPTPQELGSCATGYGTTSEGKTACFDCCNVSELRLMLAADHFTGYLSSDGRTITTWPGGTLAHVISSTTARTASFGGRGTRVYFRAEAPDGSCWHGSSPGPGMFARLHRNGKRASR